MRDSSDTISKDMLTFRHMGSSRSSKRENKLRKELGSDKIGDFDQSKDLGSYSDTENSFEDEVEITVQKNPRLRHEAEKARQKIISEK